MMLRALVLALLIANLGFFAWSEGWLDRTLGASPRAEREPERALRQVRPETIRLIPPGAPMPAASAATVAAAPPACLESAPMDLAQAGAAEAALKRLEPALPEDSWRNETAPPAGRWLVYMGRYAGPDALARKEEELRRRRLDFEVLQTPATLAPGLVLGRYADRPAADAALAGLARQDIRTARVVQSAAVEARVLRFDGVDPALAARVAGLQGEVYGDGFKPCAGRGTSAAAAAASEAAASR